MKHKLLIGLAVLVTLTALLVVSCAKATPTPTPKPTATPTATPMKVATPTPKPSGETPSGKVVFTTTVLDAMIGDPAQAPYRNWEQSGNLQITEYLFVHDQDTGDPMTPYLAEDWEVTPDGKKVVIKVRKGIPWYTPPLPGAEGKDFGELSAEDAVWFLNHNNSNTNPDTTSGDAGDLAAVFGEARVVDQYTFEIEIVSPIFFGFPLSQFGVLGAAPSIRSKAVFDQMGAEWARDWPVGTGPFVLKEWKANDRGILEAVPEHWSMKGKRIKELVRIQVAEATAAIAMLKAGDADIADLDFSVMLDAAKDDAKLDVIQTMRGGYVTASAIFAGNLWEDTLARTGEPVDPAPWDADPYAEDYPWIGNPWGNKVPYADIDNPSGMSDMEQARLVRWALSYAIDREGIAEQVLGGLGLPLYSEYMGPEYPGWDPNRTITYAGYQDILSEHGWSDSPEGQVEPAMADKAWPWKVDYDPDYATELLEMAGYDDGFSLSMNAYRCELGDSCFVVADAVNSMWQDIGINASITKADYSAVVSPNMRARQQYYPVIKNGDVHSNVWPIDWPYPPVDSTMSRPGWGVGFENEFNAKMHVKIRANQNRDENIKWHLQTVDHIMYWQLYNGIIIQPKSLLVRSDKIASWEGPQEHYSNYGSPAYIKLVGW